MSPLGRNKGHAPPPALTSSGGSDFNTMALEFLRQSTSTMDHLLRNQYSEVGKQHVHQQG